MEGRQPKDLQGLLRFAMELTKAEDAPNSSQFQPMDEERKKFLEKVINSMTVNVVEEFEKALGILDSAESTDEEKVQALEAVKDFVDNIDNANNFVKIGGDKVVIPLLTSKNAEIRRHAASLIAEMCQNNPFCQKRFGNTEIFQILINLLNDTEVAVNAMHAISCLIRNHEPSMAAFIELGGLECLLACATSEKERLSFKACFLISALSTEFVTVRDKLIQLGVIEKLAECVKPISEFDVRDESVLSSLNIFVESKEGKKRYLKSNLKGRLEEILKTTENKPEYEEIRLYCQNLVNVHSTIGEDNADR